jgi:hypothetical protein
MFRHDSDLKAASQRMTMDKLGEGMEKANTKEKGLNGAFMTQAKTLLKTLSAFCSLKNGRNPIHKPVHMSMLA